MKSTNHSSINHFLWVEKYRPQKIDDVALPAKIKKIFKEFLKEKRVPNLLLCGAPGCGKTTIAKALANELDADTMFVNASMEGKIDVLRTKIKDFASSVSVSGKNVKVVILDEIEGSSTSQSFQPALRAFIEEFSKNCIFILTCNYKNRVIEPIQSRCTVIDFIFDEKDKEQMQALMFKRLCTILRNEGVEYDKAVIAKLITKYFPDFRRLINSLQAYAKANNRIDVGIFSQNDDFELQELMAMLKNKKFGEVRKWVANNSNVSDVEIYRKIYDHLYEYLEPTSIPKAVIIIGEYMFRSSFVADHEINLMACLTTLMVECRFK